MLWIKLKISTGPWTASYFIILYKIALLPLKLNELFHPNISATFTFKLIYCILSEISSLFIKISGTQYVYKTKLSLNIIMKFALKFFDIGFFLINHHKNEQHPLISNCLVKNWFMFRQMGSYSFKTKIHFQFYKYDLWY